VVTSDHGHTEVQKDDAHALAMKGDDDPPALVKKAGYRLRPFKHEVDEDDDFQAVLAYQGAFAYAYVADRSTCGDAKKKCDWSRPPRFKEDVLPLADAFFQASETGAMVPQLKGTLDLVLTREPRPYAEEDLPFQVYTGGGKLVPVAQFLAEHPHPEYVALERRLEDLGKGPHGERSGDVVLLANNGNRKTPQERFYFAGRYRSWHGSPSAKDSEVPFIVAHPAKTSAELGQLTTRILGKDPYQYKVTDLLLAIRSAPPAGPLPFATLRPAAGRGLRPEAPLHEVPGGRPAEGLRDARGRRAPG
jgi:hypothetical protein